MILDIGRKQKGKQSRNINVLKPHASTTDMQKELPKNIKQEKNEKGYKTRRNKILPCTLRTPRETKPLLNSNFTILFTEQATQTTSVPVPKSPMNV